MMVWWLFGGTFLNTFVTSLSSASRLHAPHTIQDVAEDDLYSDLTDGTNQTFPSANDGSSGAAVNAAKKKSTATTSAKSEKKKKVPAAVVEVCPLAHDPILASRKSLDVAGVSLLSL
jgi:hypothetical protein